MSAARSSAWATRRGGELNQFFTRAEATDMLTQQLGCSAPVSVLDLGAGEGSLSAAVAEKWPGSKFTTVDIDSSCCDRLKQRLRSSGVKDHVHFVWDVFDHRLPELLGCKQFDLAVCNPPFFKPEWRREFSDILRDANITSACRNESDVTAELIFFAQNLRVVRSGGLIALIVPDGLATGYRYRAFRAEILQKHHLIAAIQLPSHAFIDTEAHCFILIIQKEGLGDATKLLRLYKDGSTAVPIEVDVAKATMRLDYDYHSISPNASPEATTLRELGADIQRGSLTTAERKMVEEFVFHTGDFLPGERQAILQDILPPNHNRMIIAQPGDILMARIDRNLHEKIVMISRGRAAITDCVYRIRLPSEYQRLALSALTSDKGRRLILAATKGVGARLLGKADLLDLPIIGPNPHCLQSTA